MSTNSKKKKETEGGGTPLWMVTFSDLATLLLTFFVLLLSMASMDDKTLKSMFTNFTSACGILNYKEYGEVYKPKEVLIEGLYSKLADNLIIKRADDPVEIPSETDETFIAEIGSQVVFENIKNGFKIVFGHQLMFESGSAEIKDDMKDILQKIAKFMLATAYQIYIDGHTDNIPINTKDFPSNEDLSLKRAYNIMEYLVNGEGISPYAIALAGYGEHLPIETNDTASERAKNRRVEIIFKNKKYF